MALIRRAVPDDVPGIAAVVDDAFQEQIDQSYCRVLLSQRLNHVAVAVETSGEIAGFVSGFLTTDLEGLARWEVDLLAVRTTSRGQRLAPQLIEATWQDALEYQANYARGFVRLDNHASQNSFARAGYETDEQHYGLYIWSGYDMSVAPQLDKMAHVNLIPVETLTYRGLWIEGLDMPDLTDSQRKDLVMAAQHQITQDKRDNTGAMVLDHTIAEQLGGENVGVYQCWTKGW